MNRYFTPAGINLLVLGLFQTIAALGNYIPGFVTDRVPKQYVPVWTWLLGSITGPAAEGEVHGSVMAASYASVVVFGTAELAVGLLALAAYFFPARRVRLGTASLTLAGAVFGLFMLTMFAMHDKSLPAWNQYPAIFAWFALTYLLVLRESDDVSPSELTTRGSGSTS
ncbi:MAG: hypothetical protein GC161_19650 [Planctomycetaceae bacterium]|nr:hypothetical protein [Planctomycetaceae bacterium]